MKIAMLCPCGKRSSDNPPILDVEKIIQDYVWREIKTTSHPLSRVFLRRRDFDIEVPMNYFHFEDVKQSLTPRQKTQENSKSKTNEQGNKAIPDVSVLSTQFRNNTNKNQTYKFRFERTRKVTIKVTFQKGFSIGGKAQFKLGLPKIIGEGTAGGEVDMRLQISKTMGEDFEETLTLEANSDINVEENCNYTAKVALTEREVSANFRVETMMRMPSGTAPVSVRRKKDRELYCTIFLNDLKKVFTDYKDVEAIDESGKEEEVARYAIRFVTTGIVEGMRLSGQKIFLDSEKLDNPPTFRFSLLQDSNEPGATSSKDYITDLLSPLINFPSDSEDNKDDNEERKDDNEERKDDNEERQDDNEEPRLGIINGPSETRILKAPQIPTIITTAPSSQETSPQSDDDSLKDIKDDEDVSLKDIKDDPLMQTATPQEKFKKDPKGQVISEKIKTGKIPNKSDTTGVKDSNTEDVAEKSKRVAKDNDNQTKVEKKSTKDVEKPKTGQKLEFSVKANRVEIKAKTGSSSEGTAKLQRQHGTEESLTKLDSPSFDDHTASLTKLTKCTSV